MKKAKAELEAELETLSQALFEEANKMVADERKKRAEKEDEAREAIEEREALRKLVKLMEAEKAAGRRASSDTTMTAVDSGKDVSRNHMGDDRDATDREETSVPGGFPAGQDSQVWLGECISLSASPHG
jgi:membrane protein involved in colicin uptake